MTPEQAQAALAEAHKAMTPEQIAAHAVLLVGGIFKLFGFADGTDFSPGGLAMVGERGRELVNLPRGSQVVPNHMIHSPGAGGSGGGELQVEIKAAWPWPQ